MQNNKSSLGNAKERFEVINKKGGLKSIGLSTERNKCPAPFG